MCSMTIFENAFSLESQKRNNTVMRILRNKGVGVIIVSFARKLERFGPSGNKPSQNTVLVPSKSDKRGLNITSLPRSRIVEIYAFGVGLSHIKLKRNNDDVVLVSKTKPSYESQNLLKYA